MLPYTAPAATLQQLLQRQPAAVTASASAHVRRVLSRLSVCGTAALGYHLYRCADDSCGGLKYQYHSCRDRHCPRCGALKKEEWMEARMQELLPVKYYHVVFTLPHELNSLILGHRNTLFKLLFDASAQTLLSFAKDEQHLGALPGIISVLHTWGQQLSFHPHIHCIVSGGGISGENDWKAAKKNPYGFLFPVKAMSQVFKTKYLQGLKRLLACGDVMPPASTDMAAVFSALWEKQWVVYAKAPFGGPQTVIEYLGRYTHKVAISNHRISSINEADNTVTFRYKDYGDDNRQKLMTLTATEFIRRFEQHILPKGFTKIRTYGYLANRNRKQRINGVLKKMKLPQHKGLVKIPLEVRLRERGIQASQCPCCGQQSLQLVMVQYTGITPAAGKQADDG